MLPNTRGHLARALPADALGIRYFVNGGPTSSFKDGLTSITRRCSKQRSIAHAPVARISHGPTPPFDRIAMLEEAARAAIVDGITNPHRSSFGVGDRQLKPG
jgi:hypothetical protein